ncbi:hypothetical protein [Chryseobacterium daeguense]|uniref:hypothetical protein n=1 Tax=Chryseobacterium daeguense TaxID=412438 RepID=UPI00040AD42B|nr:hypothetical protein [Chryseobacterium daeguense]
MEINTIYQSIKNWKTLIDSYQGGNEQSGKDILQFLNQGTHFSVDGSEVKEWKKRLENESDKAIHVYTGIDNNLLKFFMIDSKSDAAGDFSYIVVKDFNRTPPQAPINVTTDVVSEAPITSESAIYRNFRFNMYCSAWIPSQKTEFFRIISVPFDDYERMQLADDQHCTSFFGLTNEAAENSSMQDYHLEIVTVKDIGVNSISQTAENYSTPRPPFTANDPVVNYQLLLKSDAYI